MDWQNPPANCRSATILPKGLICPKRHINYPLSTPKCPAVHMWCCVNVYQHINFTSSKPNLCIPPSKWRYPLPPLPLQHNYRSPWNCLPKHLHPIWRYILAANLWDWNGYISCTPMGNNLLCPPWTTIPPCMERTCHTLQLIYWWCLWSLVTPSMSWTEWNPLACIPTTNARMALTTLGIYRPL